MDFTGERYVPTLNGEIRFEHLHRYAISLDYIKDKAVLDIASGEGYGSAMLATQAKHVTGVDIDPTSIKHAVETYSALPNLSFSIGSCDAIPLADASVDVVVSFETIEHHDKHVEMLNEIKRVLRPDGVLIISSPNRVIYSEAPDYKNPFHVKELDLQELDILLQGHFSNVSYFGQDAMGGSFIYKYRQPFANFRTIYDVFSTSDLDVRPPATKEPTFFIAFCSEANIEYSEPSIYLNPENDLVTHIKKYLDHVLTVRNNELEINKAQVARHQEQITAYDARINRFEQLLEKKQEEYVQLRAANQTLQENVNRLEDSNNELKSSLNSNYSSLRALQNTTTVRVSTKVGRIIGKIKERLKLIG